MPDLRRVADEREPPADLRSVPGLVCSRAATCLRRLRRPLPGLTPEPRSVRNEGRALLCPACRDKTYAFERARSFAMYEGPLVGAILLLKFEQIEPLGAWFAERLAELMKEQGSALAADVVVPVPLHRRGSASEGTTRRRCSPSRWRSGCDYRIKPSC